MINATFTSPFDAPPAGGLVAVELACVDRHLELYWRV